MKMNCSIQQDELVYCLTLGGNLWNDNCSVFIYLLKEIGISRENFHQIQDLEAGKDITILHGGVGGYRRISVSFFLYQQEVFPKSY